MAVMGTLSKKAMIPPITAGVHSPARPLIQWVTVLKWVSPK